MCFNNMLDNGQTKPSSTRISTACFINSIKPLKKSFNLLLVNSNSSVFHFYPDIFTLVVDDQCYFSVFWGVVNSICRSVEHTSELQSRGHLVCRLLLERKN